MKKNDSLLLVIDVQERLAPAMDNPREVINGCAVLLGVARELDVPCIITEQYPQGLGQTMVDLRNEAGEKTLYLPKLEFSCLRNDDGGSTKVNADICLCHNPKVLSLVPKNPFSVSKRPRGPGNQIIL